MLIRDSHPDVRYFIHRHAVIYLHVGFTCCTALWCHYRVCLTMPRTVCYRTDAVHELPSPLLHLLYWQTCITVLNFHSSMNFDGFHPFTISKTDDRILFFFGACCKRGRQLYTTTAPSCCIPASSYHLSATLQTISNTVFNLQDNLAVLRIFIALLRFSFDSPSYYQSFVLLPTDAQENGFKGSIKIYIKITIFRTFSGVTTIVRERNVWACYIYNINLSTPEVFFFNFSTPCI